MKKVALLPLVILFIFSCNKKPSYSRMKDQATMSQKEAKKRIKKRPTPYMNGGFSKIKIDCPPTRSSKAEKKYEKKEARKMKKEQKKQDVGE